MAERVGGGKGEGGRERKREERKEERGKEGRGGGGAGVHKFIPVCVYLVEEPVVSAGWIAPLRAAIVLIGAGSPAQ